MAPDPVILGKLVSNRYILGMTQFSMGVIFNMTTFFALITSGIIKQSTGLYLLFLMVADTLYLLCTVFMEEFYNPLIDVDIFDQSGEGVLLCQIVYFFREMCYYWRWYLVAIMVIDRCLLVSGTLEMPRLRIFAVIMTLVGLAISSGLAGYWIYWVDNELFVNGFVAGGCRFTLAPLQPDTGKPDTSSTWFIMEAIGTASLVWSINRNLNCFKTLKKNPTHVRICAYLINLFLFAVHILYPDGILGMITLISSIVLLSRLNGKAAENLDADDYSLSKVVVGIAFVNLLLHVPYLVVNCIIKYIDRAFDTYDLSETIDTNLTYAATITSKARDFEMCIAFWVLIFARPFRAAFCKN